jgi:bacterioferritin
MADARQQLIDGLNEDLAAEYGAVIMYRTYASLASGPSRTELKAFFEGEIPDELGHAAFLADKIVALGGKPTTKATEVPYTTDNRAMLEHALQAERTPSPATPAASTRRTQPAKSPSRCR